MNPSKFWNSISTLVLIFLSLFTHFHQIWDVAVLNSVRKCVFFPITFFYKSNDAMMKLFYFSSRKNGLCKRNKNQFIFLIDNLNNLATKMANKETLQKKYGTNTSFLPTFNTTKFQIGWKWVNKERKIRMMVDKKFQNFEGLTRNSNFF
jgi:hypothetical protein